MNDFSSIELSLEFQEWVFEKYGFCHMEDNHQFLVAVYSMAGFREDRGYNVGMLDHVECLYCGGMLCLDGDDPQWK